MSRTFKDTPEWVRERRNRGCREVHVGCPYADEPIWRFRRTTVTVEPHWRQVEVTVRRFIAPGWRIGPGCDDWWATSTHLEWRYEATVEPRFEWRPYWADVCDLAVRDNKPSRHCHYATELWERGWRHREYTRHYNAEHGPDGTIRYAKRRRRSYDKADRRNARAVLADARREWNTVGDTDLQPWHTPYRSGWWD